MMKSIIIRQDQTELASLAERFGSDKGRYCAVYEKFLESSRLQPLNLFEIGVGGYDDPLAGGASLRMWEAYLPNALIFALDFYDKQAHAADRVRVYQGSQNDGALLRSIAAQVERLDVVLDDGSHISSDVISSFETLFPLLAPGGLYIVEDVGTSYWPSFGGNIDPDAEGTSMSYFKRLADSVNHLDSQGAIAPTDIGSAVAAVHFYPSLILVEKNV